jgi:hypothetical protein
LVLHVAVDVKRLFEIGKAYPWPRPDRCLSCRSPRVWGHGYVPRYFEGYNRPLWVKRLRCPDCRTVYTLRPDVFLTGFRYSLCAILCSLIARILHHRFVPCLPRQNQQYWYKGLIIQASQISNTPLPDMAALSDAMSRGIIPMSHSLHCAIRRL